MKPPTPHPLTLKQYGRARDDLLRRITTAIESDPRACAAWLLGSFGRGEADAWSDLDLHVAIGDADFPAFWQERQQLFARVGEPVLVQSEMTTNSIDLPGGNYQLVIYRGPVEVDWVVGPLSAARRSQASQVLFDRVGVPVVEQPVLTAEERQGQAGWWLTFFWAMAPITVKYAGRGETRLAAAHLDLLSTAAIALWRLVEQPTGPNPWAPSTNRPLEDEVNAWLPQLGRTIGPAAVLRVVRELCAAVEGLHPRLAPLGATVPAQMPSEVAALCAVAEAVIREGSSSTPRKYR